jgi:probable DNA repair protein
MLDDLFAQLKPNTLILTANKRLASWIAYQHHDWQISRGISTWPSLDVLPFNAWLKRCFTELQTKACGAPLILLNPQQSFLLWQTIIHDQTDDALLSVNATASAAQDAWNLLQKYNVNPNDPELSLNDDNLDWKNWAETFVQTCKDNNWIDNASLIKFINSQLGNLNTSKHIILVGFLELTPAEQLLLDKLNCEINFYQARIRNQSTKRMFFANTEDEIYAMANWTKQQLKATTVGARRAVPLQNAKNIGCIIPNLNEIYNDVKRIFAETFADDTQYNISYGDKLSNEPIIYAALEILSLNIGKIHIDDIGFLLRSPFIGNFKELPQRAIQDAQLRQMNQTEFTLNQLNTHCDLFKTLQTIKFKQHLSPREWVDVFTKQFNALGWPGTRELTGKEFKTIEHWHELLQEFAALDLVINSFSHAQALVNLKRLASQTLFQTKKPHYAPIQILGTLEATGLCFDHAWMMGLDDKNWPETAKPNPFLPISLQKKYNMSHATAEREFHFARLITQKFMQNSSGIIFSYAQQNQDGVSQHSPLIKDFPLIENFDVKSHFEIAQQKFTNISDDQAPPVQENEALHASVDILEQQAACPFRAFAKHRLQACEIPKPTEGINALDRGSITHKILELIWKQIKTHKKLCSMNENELKKLIDASIQKSLKIKSEFAKLEQQRLHKLIYDWLQHEKKRASFSVAEQEQKYTIKCGKLKLNVRIDRIDKLKNNTHILIDYKTGKSEVKINDWLGDRPNKPQLPLYAANIPQKIDDIAFAQILPGKLAFKNAAKEINWQEQLKSWKKITANLADDFYNGKAKVDPKNPNNTCKFCKLHSLCRIYENT